MHFFSLLYLIRFGQYKISCLYFFLFNWPKLRFPVIECMLLNSLVTFLLLTTNTALYILLLFYFFFSGNKSS